MNPLPPARRLFSLVVLVCIALASSSVATAAQLAAAIVQADRARVDAMLSNDLAALDRSLTRDCVYVHSNGVVQSKREFLTALEAGEMRYQKINYATAPTVRRYGDRTAVLTGTTETEVELASGRTLHLTLVITALYVFEEGRWLLASYQSTNAPVSSASTR